MSTLTQRLAHKSEAEVDAPPKQRPKPRRSADGARTKPPAQDAEAAGPTKPPAQDAGEGNGDRFERAPDVAENEGVAQTPKPKPAQRSPRTRSRRHGRPR